MSGARQDDLDFDLDLDVVDFDTWWHSDMDGDKFSPAFNKFLFFWTRNPDCLEVAVLSWLILSSWGRHKKFVCLRNSGQGATFIPASQTDCARALKIVGKDGEVNVRPVNGVIRRFVSKGALEMKGNVMILRHRPGLSPASIADDPAGGWKSFMKDYFTVNFGEKQKEIEKRQSELKPLLAFRIDKYRDWKRAQEKGTPEPAGSPADVPGDSDKSPADGIRNATETAPPDIRNATEKKSETPRRISEPLNIRNARGNSLTHKEFPANADESVGQSFSTDRPTDYPPELLPILSAIPTGLLERLNDLPTPTLLSRCQEVLGTIPLWRFTERIRLRDQTIKNLGLLLGLAGDVARTHRHTATRGAQGAPERDTEYFDALAAEVRAREESDRQVQDRIDAMPLGAFRSMTMAEVPKVRKQYPNMTREQVEALADQMVRRRLEEEIAGERSREAT